MPYMETEDLTVPKENGKADQRIKEIILQAPQVQMFQCHFPSNCQIKTSQVKYEPWCQKRHTVEPKLA
jgi:hypothetical protein